MERGIIAADPRHTVRRLRTAIQGNVMRALVELITNADDSYVRLGSKTKAHESRIEIARRKEGRCATFSVRDYAEGMSIEDVRASFTSYGASTSGMRKGQKVRGYFGHGAKDALASMIGGRICTFKDTMFVECKIFIENEKPMYAITGPTRVSQELRNTHKIAGNGTVAYFKAEPQKTGRVPQFNTIHEELANNYLLRKIMTNPERKVILLDPETGKSRRLRYRMPEGKQILSESFTISYGEYDDFPIRVSIRCAAKELTQNGDDRIGGLLLVDDGDAVLGVSLFRYDNEPLAARFFGEVRLGRFRELLDKEEAVLKEERDGLVARHPFCKLLIPEIEKCVGEKVREEAARRQEEDRSRIGREEITRYKKAFGILNEIAETEVQDVINLGQKPTDQLDEPSNGFCLYPSSAQISVGKRYAFELRLNTKVVQHGSMIKISSSTPRIHVSPPQIRISSQDGVGILQKYITAKGEEPGVEGIIQAVTFGRASEARVYVVPEKDDRGLLLSEGILFQPGSLTLRANQTRKVFLLAYIKLIDEGSRIKISSDNESIHVSPQEIVVNEANASRHIVKHELEVWGEGVNQKSIITAEHENYVALLEVQIKPRGEEKEKAQKGMFNKPDFVYDHEPPFRISYSAETGRVIIYVNFPSNKHYVGDHCQYRETLPVQVFLADLIAERCFFEIAKRKVQSSGVTLRPEAVPDRIQRDAADLSRKFGKRVHEALVDQSLLDQSRSVHLEQQ